MYCPASQPASQQALIPSLKYVYCSHAEQQIIAMQTVQGEGRAMKGFLHITYHHLEVV